MASLTMCTTNGTQTELIGYKMSGYLTVSMDFTVHTIHCCYCNLRFPIRWWSRYVQHMKNKHFEKENKSYDETFFDDFNTEATATEASTQMNDQISFEEGTTMPFVLNALNRENDTEDDDSNSAIFTPFMQPELCIDPLNIKSEQEIYEDHYENDVITIEVIQEQVTKPKINKNAQQYYEFEDLTPEEATRISERLAKRAKAQAERSRRYRKRIKNDPERHENQKQKDRERQKRRREKLKEKVEISQELALKIRQKEAERLRCYRNKKKYFATNANNLKTSSKISQ